MKLHSEVFLRNDVGAIIQALALTVASAPCADETYSQGFLSGLTAVAVALHYGPGELAFLTTHVLTDTESR